MTRLLFRKRPPPSPARKGSGPSAARAGRGAPFRGSGAWWLLAVLLLAASCGDSGTDPDDGAVTVWTTTTVLGDIARNVVGDAGTVEVLMPIGADPHDYQASAQQVAALQLADLVVVNGLGLEDGIADVLENVASDGATILEVAPRLDPRPLSEGGLDPHFWLDPERAAAAADLIAAALPPAGVDWSANARAYGEELRAADEQIADVLAAVPAELRKLVTNHDALGYFAERYGFEIVGTVVPGGAALAAPSPADLADLVAAIEVAGVPVVFAESTEPAALAEAVAAEVGGSVAVVELYTGSLGGAGSGAETLVDMLLTNARRIAAALG